MNLTQRGISSFSWNLTANIIRVPIGFIQAVALARFLPVEYFGIYTGVLALTQMSSILFEFGLNKAFVHHAPETSNLQKALENLLSLKLILYTFWGLGMISVALLLFNGTRLMTFIIITCSIFITKLTEPPRMMLIRKVAHRRLAIIQTTNSILVAIFSIAIAYFHPSIWALLASNIVTSLWSVFTFYIWKPIWKPKLGWDIDIIKYFIQFGKKAVVGDFLNAAIDRVDDLWTNVFLGDQLLGYYSRAFKFATYPRFVLSMPVNTVSFGIYAEVKGNRYKLTKAFTQIVGFIIRSGFFLAGWLLWIASNFIVLFIGDKWLPMLSTFRIMTVFLLLDPIRLALSSVLIAEGKPEKVSKTSVIQIVVLIIGLFIFGIQFGIDGVAFAVDLMLIVSVTFLFSYLWNDIDFSLIKLFAAPSLSLVIAMLGTWMVLRVWNYQYSIFIDGVLKTLIFSAIYFIILIGMEGKDIIRTGKEVYSNLGIKRDFRELFRQ